MSAKNNKPLDILFISRADDVYAQETLKCLSQYHNVYLLDVVNFKFIFINEMLVKVFSVDAFRRFEKNKIFRFALSIFLTKKYLKANVKEFDYVHILYFKNEYVFLKKEIQKLSENLIISIYGGDFFYSKIKYLQTALYKYSRIITFNNSFYKSKFIDYYGSFQEKAKDLYFGFYICDLIDEIKKNNDKNSLKIKYDIPVENNIVLVGTNGEPEQNHIELIKALNINNDEKITYLVPLTYSKDKNYISNVISFIQKLNAGNIKCFTEFMTNEAVAELRSLTDIMIQFQPKDSLSGAMLQGIYSGSLVIVPEWQVYPVLDSLDIFMIKANRISDIKEKILDYFQNRKDFDSRLRLNSSKVAKVCLWEKVVDDWLNLYTIRN